MGQALAMGDADYRKPLTPARLIERLERSNTTVKLEQRQTLCSVRLLNRADNFSGMRMRRTI
jgi:hypothetical protein